MYDYIMKKITHTITFTDEEDAFIERKIFLGEYSSRSAVVEAGLQLLMNREKKWDEKLKLAYNNHLAHPEFAVPVEKVREKLEKLHIQILESLSSSKKDS